MVDDTFRDKIKTTLDTLGDLVAEKNKFYGDSIKTSVEVFKLYYPNGISPDQYDDVLLMVRVLDKLSRIATSKKAFGESPWEDLVGYAIRGVLHDKEEPKEVPKPVRKHRSKVQKAQSFPL